MLHSLDWKVHFNGPDSSPDENQGKHSEWQRNVPRSQSPDFHYHQTPDLQLGKWPSSNHPCVTIHGNIRVSEPWAGWCVRSRRRTTPAPKPGAWRRKSALWWTVYQRKKKKKVAGTGMNWESWSKRGGSWRGASWRGVAVYAVARCQETLGPPKHYHRQ